MSFLNPVSEPVLRFSSADAGAPQINYNARVAGDVKAVLKACLVTGYGATASAGWTAANEVGNVIEFVSPSAAMSDYRLGVNDTSAANTAWYYQYQDARVNPVLNAIPKSFSYVNNTSGLTHWELLVTEQGIFFIDIIDSTVINDTVARITYFGRMKSALVASGANIAFWSVGYGSSNGYPHDFFGRLGSDNAHCRLATNTSLAAASANMSTIAVATSAKNTSVAVGLVSAMYYQASNSLFVAEQAGLMLRALADAVRPYGVYDITFNARPALSVCLMAAAGDTGSFNTYARTVLIYLDNWEY